MDECGSAVCGCCAAGDVVLTRAGSGSRTAGAKGVDGGAAVDFGEKAGAVAAEC